MKKTPLFTSTLIAASFALSVPALADTTDLPTTAPSGDSPQASSGVIASGEYSIASGATQGWISPNGAGTGSIGSYNISFGEGTTFSGSGLFGIYFVQGSGETAESVDLTNVTASGLSGQLIVLNNWNNDTTVKILGETWSDVEYIFANAVDDTELAAKYGLTDYSRGALDSDFASKGLNDTLALQGNTTLAGVTGASKGVTIYDSTGASEVLCNHEYITVTSEGTTLTIAGSGTYGFYGTVGADTSGSVVRASIVMNSSDGSGKQTFGGTNYLKDVTVTSGTLALGGTTDISGTVSVGTSGTLELGGTITLGSAISNSGTVIVDSDVVFVLDNLTPDSNTYTIISGGTITGWDSLDYTNFGLESARQLTSSSNGTITVDTTATAQNLTWAGTSGSTWNSGVSDNTVWTNNATSNSDYFVNGDSVTFTSTGAGTVTISGNVEAGTMTVSSGNYTFTASTGNTLTVDSVNVSAGNITFGVSTTIGTFNTSTTGSATGNTITLSEGTTLKVETLTSNWGSNFVLEAGSVIETDSATFATNHTDTVTGSGTWKAGTFTFDNYGTYTFEGGVSLEVDTVTMGRQSSLTLTGAGTFTIGTYQQIDDYGTPSTTFAVGENTTVNVETFTVSWHQETTTLGTGAVLNVTTELSLHTGSTEKFTGGTINAEKISLSNGASASFSSGTLNVGSGGITNASSGHIEFGDGLTVGVYNGESWSTDATIQFTGTSTGTTFSTNEEESITLSGSLSGSGFSNTGSGTLTLSGTVSLDSAIINSGNIVLDATTVSIALDSLEMGTHDEKTSYYEIITGSSGASVTFENGSYANFTLDGGSLSSSWNIWTDGLGSGYLVIYRNANDLTWAGTSGNNTWNYEATNWSDGATFVAGDNVTFGTIEGSISGTVDITTDIKAGSITVEDDYTFTTSVTEGVIVDAGGDLTVAENKTLTIDSNVTLYIDFEESDFSVEGKIAGSGTIEIDLTGNTYASTVNLGDGNEFAGTVYIHSGEFHLYGSNIGNGTYRLGDGVNIEIATSGVSVSNDFIIEGTTQLHINSSRSLTISGDVSGVEDAESVMGGNFDRHGAGDLTISGNVDIGTFTINSSGSNAVSTTTFSGSSVKIGKLDMMYGYSVVLSGSGTHTIGELLVNTTGTAHLDYSGMTGSLTITKLDFGASGTIEIKGNTSGTGTITTVDFNNAGTLAITGGIVNVGSLSDTYTSSAHAATVTIAEGSILSVGSMTFATGQAASICSSFSGASDGAGTLIVNSITIGSDSTGAATEIKDVTFISGSGGVSFGTQSGSSFYLFLDNVTWGFTGDTTIAAATGGTSRIELGDKTSGSLGTTTEATTTTINTNKYDTDSYTFTDTGVNVTIAAVIAGSGTLEVTGNGSLTLSGANEFTGGTVIDAGKVIAANASALGTGTVTIENGGQLEVSGSVTISNNINIILSTENMNNSASPNSVMTAYADSTDVYALIGTGTIADSVTITITVDEAVASLLSSEGTYYFDISDGIVLTEDNLDWSTLERYGTVSWDGDSGILSVVVGPIPEPSMFGVFFGLGALGLVATRRRRRKAA